MKVLDRKLPALVVDDSRVMCEIMCRILKQAGFKQPEYTTEGVEALHLMKTKPYGLLLTDLDMNPISGVDLIRLIWMDKEVPETPIILTSGNLPSIAKAVADPERELADAYLLKPFTADALDIKLRATFRDGN